MNLSDEYRFRAGDRVGLGGQLISKVSQAPHQLGARGDHARLIHGTHDFVNRRPRSVDGHFPSGATAADHGQTVAKRLGQQDAVTQVTVADQLIQLLSGAPGGLMQIVSCQQHASGRQSLGVSENAKGLHSGRDAAFHVRCAAALQSIAFNIGRRERQVHCVQMSIELQRPARFV